MRKLFRLATTAAALGAAAWWLRERLLPQPEMDHEPPPAFRTRTPAAETTTGAGTAEAAPQVSPAASATGDDLKRVKGIGPVYAKKLAQQGITSFADLAAADPVALAADLEISEARASDWLTQAGGFAN